MDNNSFMNNTFTWVLEDNSLNKQSNNKVIASQPHQQQQQQQEQQQQQQQQQQEAQEMANLSDADLFKFLLGEEAQQATSSQIVSVSHDNEDTIMKEKHMAAPRNTKISNGPPATSTGRLDFRPINDHIPESQLNSMTSKERRQLRNKISARNFRNRRKEYIGTLEDELNHQKAENSRLKLELKWAKQKMGTLQKENDQLRVDLVLGGISLPLTTAQAPTTMSVATANDNISPCLFDSANLLNSTLNFSNISNTSYSSSSDNSSLSSPPNMFADFPDNWDFILPTEDDHDRDTYLSHAVVPDWNINRVLEKETSTALITAPSTHLIQQYPLLAPALMSIVLAHTMAMSTDEILATAKLNTLPPSTCIELNAKDPFNGSTGMTDKEAKAVWDLLEPLTLLQSRNKKLAVVHLTKQEQSNATTVNNGSAFCLLLWIQTRVCRYLCDFAANNCTETKQESNKKFVLCRQFQKAKRYITACQ